MTAASTHHFPALVLQCARDAGPADGHGRHAAASLADLRVGLVALRVLRRREESGPGPGDGADEERRGQRRQELPEPPDLHRLALAGAGGDPSTASKVPQRSGRRRGVVASGSGGCEGV
jgi:hypothetical protein